MFTILCIFIPEALGVILFIYRKKEPFDYDAYMQSRARYTYYNRGFGGNPYNNSYYNPNNHSYESNQPADVDPFPEFSSSSKNDVGSDNPFGTEGFGQDS